MATRLAVGCALAFSLVGCTPAPDLQEASEPSPKIEVDETSAQNAALDKYVSLERATIPALMDAMPGMFSKISIDGVYPDTVKYEYVYADPVDPSEAAAYFDAMRPTLQTSFDTLIFPAMAGQGVVDQKAIIIYYSPDGSQLWQGTFEPS